MHTLIYLFELMSRNRKKRRGGKKNKPKIRSSHVYYFAYGSNMNHVRLKQRVGPIENLGKGIIKGFKLVFNTGTDKHSYANIVESESDQVEGVIYKLSARQVKILDKYEKLYLRKQLLGFDSNDKEYTFEVYIDSLTTRKTPGIPSHDYMQHLIIGAYANRLSKNYKTMLINQDTINETPTVSQNTTV